MEWRLHCKPDSALVIEAPVRRNRLTQSESDSTQSPDRSEMSCDFVYEGCKCGRTIVPPELSRREVLD
jgi:hypothetical protein